MKYYNDFYFLIDAFEELYFINAPNELSTFDICNILFFDFFDTNSIRKSEWNNTLYSYYGLIKLKDIIKIGYTTEIPVDSIYETIAESILYYNSELQRNKTDYFYDTYSFI